MPKTVSWSLTPRILQKLWILWSVLGNQSLLPLTRIIHLSTKNTHKKLVVNSRKLNSSLLPPRKTKKPRKLQLWNRDFSLMLFVVRRSVILSFLDVYSFGLFCKFNVNNRFTKQNFQYSITEIYYKIFTHPLKNFEKKICSSKEFYFFSSKKNLIKKIYKTISKFFQNI